MSVRLLRPVTKASQHVRGQLVDGLDVGQSKKLDNDGPHMAVHIHALQRTGAGVLYSVRIMSMSRATGVRPTPVDRMKRLVSSVRW